MVRTPEKYEKDEIDKHLKRNKIYFLKPATGGYGESGHSDRIGCVRGNFFSIEVKREGKEPTSLQWRRIAQVTDAGGKAFWGTSEKVIPEFDAWLASL